MIVRTMARGLALSTIALPGAAWCLGLGDLTVDTALNQPLHAEIKLLSVSPAELDDMRVSLASKETFDRIGIERPFVLSQLQFRSAQTPDGQAILEVTSKQPLREPFLNFLVEVEWPNGRLLREYTVLLDPPVLMEQRQAASVRIPEVAPQTRVAAPPAQASSSLPQESTRPDVNPPGAAGALNESSGAGVAGGRVEYTVVRGDTLYAIAAQFRPDAGASPSQVMLGILRANRQAFADGNINNLKAGTVLRIPAGDAFAMPSEQEAFAEVTRHNEQWQDARTQHDPAAVAPSVYGVAAGSATSGRAEERTREQVGDADDQSPAPDATAAASNRAADGRLKIMGVPESRADVQATGAENRAAAGAAQTEGALARELAESRRVEVEALSTKLAELEAIVTKQERIIQLQAKALTEFQQRLDGVDTAERGQKAPEILSDGGAVERGAVTKQAAPTGSIDADSRTSASGPGAQPTPAQPTGLIEAIFANPAMLAGLGAGAILVLGLIWLLVRRAASNRAETVDLAACPGENLDAAQVESRVAPAGDGKDEVAVLGEAAQPSDPPETMQDKEASTTPTNASPVDETSGHDADSGNDDTLAEADVYIAYGLQQQAEDLLKEAVKSNPTNIDYRVKLLEVHYATKNVEGFETEAHALHQSLAGKPSGVWERVATMGTQLNARNPLFVGFAAGGAAEPPPAGGELSFTASDHDTLQGTQSEHSGEGGEDGYLAHEEAPSHARDDHILEFDGTDLEATTITDFSAQASTHTLDLNEAALDIDLSDVQADTDAEAFVEPAPIQMTEMPPGASEFALGDEPRVDFDSDGEGGDDHFLIEEPEMTDALTDEPPGALMTDILLEGDDGLNADDFSSLTNDTEAGTKLDLARAYLDMGDSDGAMSTLAEVIEEGDDEQRKEAEVLMRRIA